MRRWLLTSTRHQASGGLSNDIDIDIIKLSEALGRSIVFAMGKMKYKYNRELEWMTFYDSKENMDLMPYGR